MPIVTSGARLRVAYVAETTPGTTPATPAFKQLPVTGGNLTATKVASAVRIINSDRQFRDAPQAAQGATGTYNLAFAETHWDDMLAAALFGAWSTNVVQNGTTRQSFTLEETEDTGGGTFVYSRYPMSFLEQFQLDITAGKEITGSASFWAQKEIKDTAIVVGATYAAPANTPVMSAGVSPILTSILGLTTPKIKSIKLSIKNTLRSRYVVDQLYSFDPGEDLSEITGSVDVYVDSNAAMTAVLSHTLGAINFKIGNASSHRYQFNMPNCVPLDGRRSISGANADGMVTIPFQALWDSVTGAQLIVTRATS